MQTPKARTSTSEVPQKVSPRASSLDVPLKISPQTVSSKGPQKVSPRVVQKLKTAAQDFDLTSSPNRSCRTPKGNILKVNERKAPRNPMNEKKHASRIVELESQISQLERELEKVKDQLNSSEAWRKQALQDGAELKKQLLAMSLEPEESRLVDSAALASSINEIKELKFQLENVVKSEVCQNKQAKLAQNGLNSLEEKLAETLVLMGDVKDQLIDCREAKPHAQALVTETLMQLETAKSTVEMLRSDGAKSMEAYKEIALELEQSRGRVSLLEELVHKLEAPQGHAVCCDSQASKHQKFYHRNGVSGKSGDPIERSANIIEVELHSFKSEVERLRSTLEAAEDRYNEEQTRSAEEIRTAHELVEQIRSTSSQRQTELEMELKKSEYEIEELKADLMDKETELQGICEENEFLDMRLKSVLSGQREHDPEKKFERPRADIENLKANLMEKESELHNISEENGGKMSEESFNAAQETRAAEHEAFVMAGYMSEAGNKNSRRATRVLDQLMASQTANSELEAELRRLKIQADQWRKAAEAAAAMLSSENNGSYIERTGSMDNHCSPKLGKIEVPFSKATDEDLLKRKNLNMLQKFGVLRKRTQK